MLDLVKRVFGGLFAYAIYAIVLVWMARLFPSVSPLVKTLLVGLGIVAPGAGIALHLLDDL